MNKNKKLLFSIISVLLLIIVAVGVTYAYYVATATSDSISDKTAKVSLDIAVNSISTSATGSLIPLNSSISTLTQAAKGYGNTGSTFDATKSCKDKNGYTVCKIYEIVISNSGTEAVSVTGNVSSLSGVDTPNISCNVMSNNVNVTSLSCLVDNAFNSGTNISAGGSESYYMIVYVNDTGNSQNDSGSFSGVVTFNTANGNIEASF